MPTLLEERTPTDPPPNELVIRHVSGDGSQRRAPRRRPSLLLTVAVGALAVAVFLAAGVLTGLFHIGNPFGTTTVDRSPPVLLKKLKNLSQFEAAQGTFEATIDVEDNVDFIPSFIAGERTIFLAVGTVPATVDFSGLSRDAVQQTADGSVTITLPTPHLGEAVVDPKRSHVANRDRGLVNRLAGIFSDDPTSDRPLYLLAGKKLDQAAAESHLVARAERNTTAMLQGFLGKLGFSPVRVVYVEPGVEKVAPHIG
jgi:Protein of unknown function (DUF4230)